MKAGLVCSKSEFYLGDWSDGNPNILPSTTAQPIILEQGDIHSSDIIGQNQLQLVADTSNGPSISPFNARGKALC
jgi:hypothetical protein